MSEETPTGRKLRKTTIDQRNRCKPPWKKADKKKRKNTRRIIFDSEEEDEANTVVVIGTPQPTTSGIVVNPPIPTPTMSNAIPNEVLTVLTPNKKKALEDWVAANKVVVNVPDIKVKQLNTNIKPPVFEELKKTPNTYLEELEAYFKSQGFDRNDFLDLLPSVLADHTKSWLRAKKAAAQGAYVWITFKTDFKARYDTPEQQQRRQHYLATRKQGEREPVDSYIWEMMDLAHQVYPTELEAASVLRCRDGLQPRLKLAVGELQKATAEHLIDRCQQAVRDLHALDRMEDRRGKLPPPPMYKDAKEGQRQFPPRDERKQFTNRQYNNYSNNANHSGAAGYQPKPKPEEAKTGYVNKKDFRRDTRGTYGKPTPVNKPLGGQPATKINPHADKDCYLCKKTGHIARFCPTSAFFAEGRKDDEDEGKDQNNANEQTLNEQGGQ